MNEKRYFKLDASAHSSSERVYLELFDLIDKQKQFDEITIEKKMRLRGDGLRKVKGHLYRSLLKSLVSFNSKTASATIKIQEMLAEVEVLFNKRLTSQCVKTLKKAEMLTQKHAKSSYQLEILAWKARITEYHPYQIDQSLSVILKEAKEISDSLSSYTNYRILLNRISEIGFDRRNIQMQKQFADIKNSPLLKKGNAIGDFHSKRMYYNTMYWLYMQEVNPGKAYFFAKKALEQIESHPEIMNDEPRYYIGNLQNLFFSVLFLEKFDEALQITMKLKSLSENIKNNNEKEYFRFTLFWLSTRFELHVYDRKADFEAALSIVGKLERGMLEMKKKIEDVAGGISYITIIAQLYFSVNNFKKCQEWLNKILNNPGIERDDLFGFAKIIYLIVYYESGKEFYLESLVKSTYRYLLKKEKVYQFENVFMKFIRKIYSNSFKTSQLKKAFKELKEQFIELSKDTHEKIAFEYFDFIAWTESKIENRSFGEIVKEKTEARIKASKKTATKELAA